MTTIKEGAIVSWVDCGAMAVTASSNVTCRPSCSGELVEVDARNARERLRLEAYRRDMAESRAR